MSYKNNTLNLDMLIKKPFLEYTSISLWVRERKGITKVFFFWHIINTCRVASAVKSNIFKTWFVSIVKHGMYLQMNDWKLDPQLVPHYLYADDLSVTYHSYFGKLKSKTEDFVLDITISTKTKCQLIYIENKNLYFSRPLSKIIVMIIHFIIH